MRWGDVDRDRFSQLLKATLPLPVLDLLFRVRDVWRYLFIRHKYGDASWIPDLGASLGALFAPAMSVLFYPQRPPGSRPEYLFCALLGYAITTNPRHRHAVAFMRMDATFVAPDILDPVSTVDSRIINAGCADISKHHIAETFAEVFQYELEVDPTQYHGPVVAKSDLNFAHNGRVIQAPIALADVRAGWVYQKAIDNRSDRDGVLVVYRTMIYGDQIPVVCLKFVAAEMPFSRTYLLTELADPRAVFTPDELRLIQALARRLGLDYGEMDVLRDRDGRIYVVDVNTTPGGLPLAMSFHDEKKLLCRTTPAFEQFLMTYSGRQIGDADPSSASRRSTTCAE